MLLYRRYNYPAVNNSNEQQQPSLQTEQQLNFMDGSDNYQSSGIMVFVWVVFFEILCYSCTFYFY